MDETPKDTESTALVVAKGLSKIEELLGRLDRNYEHHTEEYNATAGALLRIEHARKKTDEAAARIPELVARVATIERWLIHLAEALDPPNEIIEYQGDTPPQVPTGDVRLREWAQSFRAWVKAGGRPDKMPGVAR
jgi:hypothetical protein